NWRSPPVAALVIVYVPGHGWVIWVAGVVILGVDLNAVSIWIPQVEVVGIRDTVTTRAALNCIRLTQSTELVADRDDVVLLMRCDGDVGRARARAARHCSIVHGSLRTHPRCVNSAYRRAHIVGEAQPKVLAVIDGLRHIGSDRVDVMPTHPRSRNVAI